MGILREVRSDKEHVLTGQTVVGRSRRADLVLQDDYVSGIHALLQWTGAGWEVKDLGSHNGTAVNGQRVKAGETRRIAGGDAVTRATERESKSSSFWRT